MRSSPALQVLLEQLFFGAVEKGGPQINQPWKPSRRQGLYSCSRHLGGFGHLLLVSNCQRLLHTHFLGRPRGRFSPGSTFWGRADGLVKIINRGFKLLIYYQIPMLNVFSVHLFRKVYIIHLIVGRFLKKILDITSSNYVDLENKNAWRPHSLLQQHLNYLPIGPAICLGGSINNGVYKVAEPEGGICNTAPYEITKAAERHEWSITFWKVD